MSIPLLQLISDARTKDTPAGRRFRNIENHYHLELIAENSDQLVKYQAAALAAQIEAGKYNLRALGELADRQDATNAHLNDLTEGMQQLNSGLERIEDGIDQLVAVADATLASLNEGFSLIANEMLQQQAILTQISSTLRKPYHTKMLELRDQADKWLLRGMRTTGKDRSEDFSDATRLLGEVIKNPIGNQDYVTWFQIGWLLWRHEHKAPEAEEAFYRASRLRTYLKTPTIGIRSLAGRQ